MKLRLNLLTLTLTAALLSGTASYAESVSMTTEGSMQIEADLRAQFDMVGLVYPESQNLTFGQVQELLIMFEKPYADPANPTATEKAAKASDAKLILSRINTEMPLTATNLGAIQIQDELNMRLGEVGLTPPPLNSLTVAQVSELVVMFRDAYASAGTPTEAEKTEAANKATLILNRAATPVMAGDDSAAVQMQIDQLTRDLESIGMTYPTDRQLTLDQIVTLQAAFDKPDSEATKGATDRDMVRMQEQVKDLTALLSTME